MAIIVDRQVVASSDDCARNYLITDWWSITTIDTPAGYLSSYKNLGSAIRFLNITIPPGSTITLARLIQKACATASSDTVNTRLRAERNISPATFSTKEDFDARIWTTALVNWDAIPAWTIDLEYESPNIKTCIQEVIDLPGWASGNPMVILWDDFEQRSTQVDGTLRKGSSYDHTLFAPPKLHIEYIVPAAPVVTTNPATALSAIAATPNGKLDSDGGEVCQCGFEWGLDIGYGITTPPQSKTSGETFSQVIGGLFPNTTYHFRAFATNSVGTSHGDDRSFTTALVISRAFALAREEL